MVAETIENTVNKNTSYLLRQPRLLSFINQNLNRFNSISFENRHKIDAIF